MSNRKKTGILFDLDGVLIDSERKYSEIWRRINEDYPTGVKNLERVIKGTTLPDILMRYFPDETIRKQVAERCVYEEANMTYELNVGAKELLEEIKRRGIPMAMVTSSDAVKMAHLWELLPDLRQYFDTIIASEQVTRSKPDPEGYLKAAHNIGVDATNCIVVEDSLQGIKAGKSAGALTIGITETMGRETIKGAADIIIDSISELNLDYSIAKLIERNTEPF